MNELIGDKKVYQRNKPQMARTEQGMMMMSTIAVLIDSARGLRRALEDCDNFIIDYTEASELV